MHALKRYWDRLRRRWLGRFEIEDPRPIAERAPYTYFLPSENELLALAPGDLVKLVFRSIPPAPEWEAERMWVRILETQGDRLAGTLENEPFDMPQLRAGRRIAFRRADVIDIEWAEARAKRPPSAPPRRNYWERCWVDACVLEDGTPVHYLYREAPSPAGEGEEHGDSGWRIRGDYRQVPDPEIDARERRYVALGAVLNQDDSWLHLIDAPVGASFIRDWSTGVFVAEEESA